MAAENPFSGLVEKSVSEDEAKALFQSYASSDGALSRDDLRDLLLDLQEAYHFPPVVPDESIDAVLGELVLNVEATGSVSWIEFKSFFVYLQQQPADHLHEIVLSVFNTRDLASAAMASVSMPEFKQGAGGDSEPAAAEDAGDSDAEDTGPNLDQLRDVALNAEFNPSGKECQVFVHFHAELAVLDVLLVFAADDAESLEAALAKDGTKILPESYSCSVVKYTDQRFPTIPSELRSQTPDLLLKAAETASKGLLLAKEIDEKLNISQTVQDGIQTVGAGARQGYREVADVSKEVVDSAKEVAHTLDETMRFSETLRTVTTAFTQEGMSLDENYHISETVAQTAQQVDETLKISENVRNAKEGLQSVATTATNTLQETVDSAVAQVQQSSFYNMGMGWFSGIASTVTSAVEDFSRETMEIVSQQSPDAAESSAAEDADADQKDQGAAPPAAADEEAASSSADAEEAPAAAAEEAGGSESAAGAAPSAGDGEAAQVESEKSGDNSEKASE